MAIMGVSLFGLSDPAIILAHVLCIAASLLCIIYGAVNWNRGAENEADQIAEESTWQQKEDAIDETL